MFSEKGSIWLRNWLSANKLHPEVHKLKLSLGYRENDRIPRLVYDYHFPDANKSCLTCSKETRFKNYQEGYLRFCSSTCSNKVKIGKGSRPEHSRKMRELFSSDRGEEVRKKISKKSRAWHDSEAGKKQNLLHSKKMKERIEKGLFTPNITNTWTRWNVEVDGKKFRSTFEGIVYLFFDKKLEYEKLRISYSFEGDKKIYIVDFIDPVNKVVYEVKPSSLVEDEKNSQKLKSLKKWCIDNSYAMKILTEDDVRSMALAMQDHPFAQKVIQRYQWN